MDKNGLKVEEQEKLFKEAIKSSVFDGKDEKTKDWLLSQDPNDSERFYFENDTNKYRGKLNELLNGNNKTYYKDGDKKDKFKKYSHLELHSGRKPHMLAVYSSSRIGFFYFLRRRKAGKLEEQDRDNSFEDFDAEFTIKKDNIDGGAFTPDFRYVNDKAEEIYVECKCREILDTKLFRLKPGYKNVLKDYYDEDSLFPELHKDFEVDDKGVLMLLKLKNKKGEDKVRGSRVDFDQMLRHLIGISTLIDRDPKENSNKIHRLRYIYFIPKDKFVSGEEKRAVLEKFMSEVKEDYAKFRSSPYYTQLKYVNDEKGPLILDELPCFIEVEPDILL